MTDKLIQFPPAPSDAELQADRDAKHAAEVDRWMRNDDKLGADLRLAAKMRVIIPMLREINTAYEMCPEGGSWSPRNLTYEADYLERHCR